MYFEVLFVDDGSVDRSWLMIEQFCRDSPRFKGLRLSRNFGAHTALSAGIDHAHGGMPVATLACDLQDPPEVLVGFVENGVLAHTSCGDIAGPVTNSAGASG